MPGIGLDFLRQLQCDYRNYPNFIETGTYYGDTILHMEQYFLNLYTVEIQRTLYEHVTNNYKGDKIKFHLGNSEDVLNEILPTINGPSIFFLDGHWSAGCTGKGRKDCPLYEELNSIMLNHRDKAIIIIDDVRLFGRGPNKGNEISNWEDINTQNILEIVKGRITDHYFLPSDLSSKDRLIINISRL